jgi:Carboxypeptidase regulatory-like domain/TonB-dependent Receptor Plug Domain/TonB dependent receptor
MSLRGQFALLLVTFLVVCSAPASLGQSQTAGRIAGGIRDAQGQGIPRAKILAVTPSTAQEHASLTNDSGDYVLMALPPGSYDVTITSPGFATSVFRSIYVGVGDTTAVNAVLQIAQNTTEVTVNDAPPLLRTDNSELGTSLDSASLSTLPLSMRNSLQLLALAPGANTALPNNSSLGRNSPQVSVNGARVNQNSYQINGVDANNIAMHDFGDVGVPAPESISSVNMQTSMYDASVSGAGGSTVDVITKSGTNSLHGSLYEYFGNKALNANDPILKSVGIARPVLKRNIFGATLGGPARKDRAFYFVSYQGTREANGATGQSLYSNVQLDPCLTNDRSTTTLMANCQVSNVDPTALALLNSKLPNGQFLVPTPQHDGLASGTATSTYHEDQFNTNFDCQLGARDSLAARFFFADAPLFSALGSSAFAGAPSFPGFGMHIKVSNRLFSLQENHSFGPTTVNEMRFGYNWVNRDEAPQEAITDSQLGISRITAAQFPGLPYIVLNRLGGGAAIGTNEITLHNASPSVSFADILSLQRGKHNLRLGGDIRQSTWRIASVNLLSYGEIDFATFQDFVTGNTEASFLGTGVNQVEFRTTDYHLFAQDDWRISSQLTLNLGLRYELDPPPYEVQGRIGGFDPALYKPASQVDENGFPIGPPAEGIFIAGNAPQSDLPGVTRVGKRILKSVDPLDFGPRIGVAWSPQRFGKLIIRAGYGIFYSRPSFLNLGLNYAQPPFYQITSNSGQSFTNPFPGAPPTSTFPMIPAGTLLGSPFAFLDRNNLNPYFQQFNASIQYEIFRDAVLQVAYVGSRGLRLYRQLDINQARVASLRHPITNAVTGEVITLNTLENAPLRAPFQGADPASVFMNQSAGQSTYHSLQATFNLRMSYGVQLYAAYTFSKSMDDTPFAGGGANTDGTLDTSNALDSALATGNPLDPRANRGLSDFDRTHRFVLSFVWDLPTPKFSDSSRTKLLLFSNWQVSGIVTSMSGLPINIFDLTGGTLYGLFSGSRPSWAPGATLRMAKSNVPPGFYFNPYAFAQALVQPGQPIPSAHDPTALAGVVGTDYGNVGRNILRGPSQANLDFSILKRFTLTESKVLEFRAGFFNALNQVSKSNPVGELSNATLDPINGHVLDPGNFGRILGANSSPRIIQLSLKLNF